MAARGELPLRLPVKVHDVGTVLDVHQPPKGVHNPVEDCEDAQRRSKEVQGDDRRHHGSSGKLRLAAEEKDLRVFRLPRRRWLLQMYMISTVDV